MNPCYKKAALVWYLQRDGTYREAKVVSVDVTVDPPSYAVDLGDSVRETEAHRLQPRQAGEAPPSVPAQRPLADPALEPQQAVLDEEDDDFGDFADAPEAVQPCVSPRVPHSHMNGFAPSANGYTPSVNSFTQHLPRSNGFSHAPGMDSHAAGVKLPNSATALAPAAVSQYDDEEGFGDFADADVSVPGPSDAAAQGAEHAYSAHTPHNGQPWSDIAGFGGPAAMRWPDQLALKSLHASSQHARGPSVESAASLGSLNGPAYGGFDRGLPPGLMNGAKAEREYRVTPASTLSIAQQELSGDSDDDFGAFEDAQPDAAAGSSATPILLDRHAPIPLSLFGEEEDDSAPAEPVLDLAAPWGGFLTPGQPRTSAVAEQEKAAAPQSAVMHAAQAPDGAMPPMSHQAVASSVPELADSAHDGDPLAQQPTVSPYLGRAASLAAESSDSWVTAFTEASQTLPGSNAVPGGPAGSEDAAFPAQFAAPDTLLGVGEHTTPSRLQSTEMQDHCSSTSHSLQGTIANGPNDAGPCINPGKLTAGTHDAAVSDQASSAQPAEDGATSAQAGPGAQGHMGKAPHSIDWSAMDFDFGAPGSPVHAEEPASQQASLDPGVGDRSSSIAAEAHASHSNSLSEEAPGCSIALAEKAWEPASVEEHAGEEDDWDYGDFAEASLSIPGASLKPATSGGVPALDSHDFQASSAAGAQPTAEASTATSEVVNPNWDEGSAIFGTQPTPRVDGEGPGDSRDGTATSAEAAAAGDEWGSWDASPAAAEASSPVNNELGGAPSLETALAPPRTSAQLAPGGSGVLSFDQWGRAYSKLEQQVARSGAAKHPAANPEAAETLTADAGTFSLPEPSWEASQATTADVWASLAALDEANALGGTADSVASHPPVKDAQAAGSMPSGHASTDPFAAFDSVAEEVDPRQTAGPVVSNAEGESFSLPMPAADSTADSWSASEGFVSNQPTLQGAESAKTAAHRTSAIGTAGSIQQELRASGRNVGQPVPAASLPAQRSWGDGWADSVSDSMVLPPDQATWPLDAVSSWKPRQEEDVALEKALGCDRQTALLCLAQAAAGILVAGQQLWAEACLLGSLGSALDCRDVQQYLAALAHVRFVACAVDAALCCGAASAPSMEAELCRALAQCEEAWQQSPSGAASLAEALEALVGGTSSLAPSAGRAQEASQGLAHLRSAGKLDPSGAKCPLTGLPLPVCLGMPLAELHGRPSWAPVANLYLQHGPTQASRRVRC